LHEHKHDITPARTFRYAVQNRVYCDSTSVRCNCYHRVHRNPDSPGGNEYRPGNTGCICSPRVRFTRGILTTVPTDALPGYNMVQRDVAEKDYLGIITITFQEGMGMNSIKKVDITLTRADATNQTATVGTKKGDEVEFQGTRGTGSERGQADRVEVWVTTNEVQNYKIVDVLREYRSR
jgi:hypothetical protein